ncbi:MAG TPA: type II toxin-antitoxin system HicB family antitoxin [Candidatus Acidoferrales bacterium]|nr:type II toxin-antitoxin system HicB family antitoxin [Candidatus Acidoferrales bacterium]
MDKKKPPESAKGSEVHFLIEAEQEEDGRWIAEIAALPGALAYGGTEEQARANAYALALRVIADEVEHSKSVPKYLSISSVFA